MKKALIAVACVLALGACANGGSDDGPRGSDAPRRTGDDAPATTPGVKRAKEGRVNLPPEGSYRYEYTSEATDLTKPDATPRRADDDAELRRRVSVSGEVVTTSDKTTEGPAVATVKRRYDDKGIYETSTSLKASGGTSSCSYEEPILVLPVPPKEGELDPQALDGRGAACNGERIVNVEGEEDVQDADGTTWRTWKITMKSEIDSGVGVQSRSTLTTWFSPDLGMDVKVESVAEALSQGEVVQRGESSQLLTSYPS